MDRKQLATIAVGCAAVAIIGCLFLTWPSIDFQKDMPDKAKDAVYKQFDDKVNNVGPLLLSIAAGACALLVMLGMTALVPLDARQLLFIGCALFGIAALLTLIAPLDLDWIPESNRKDVSKGLGVWLTLLACAGGAAASFLATTKKKGKAAPKPAAADAPAAKEDAAETKSDEGSDA
jgi:drug/metabolite transporter (DMT)-like permease